MGSKRSCVRRKLVRSCRSSGVFPPSIQSLETSWKNMSEPSAGSMEITQMLRRRWWTEDAGGKLRVRGRFPYEWTGKQREGAFVDLNCSYQETNRAGICCSCNRKNSNDGNERNTGCTTIGGGTRSTSSEEISQAGDCATGGVWSNGLRGTEALPRSDASYDCVPTARVASSVKVSKHSQRDATATRSNCVEKCSPGFWTIARAARLFPVRNSNTSSPNGSISR
jgi:hypothetical protein